MWEEDFRKELVNYFEAQKVKNHRFSLRALALRIDLSPGSLSEILNGTRKWNLSVERAVEILEKIQLPQKQTNHLLMMMGQQPQIASKEMASDAYYTLANWIYHPILMCFDLPNEHHEAAAIAKRLAVSVDIVEQAILRMLETGLLQKNIDGKIIRNEEFWETSDGIPNEAIRGFHQEGLSLSSRALKEIPVDERDFTSLTYVGKREDLPKIREEIRRFQDRLTALSDPSDSNEVFHLAVQLFPIQFSSKEDS